MLRAKTPAARRPKKPLARSAGVLALAVASLAVTAPPAQAGLLGGLLGTVGGLVQTTVGVVSTALDTTTGLIGGADWGYAPTTTTLGQAADAVGADTMWARGYTGKGVGVALIDTGVVPVQGLTSGNVVNGPDLSFDSQSPSPNLDAFGHGTHMAGIIAGNDGTNSGFHGIAPDATLLSVKVGASDGGVDVSQTIAAIDWVVQHRNDPDLNIRVLNLSFGTDGTQATTLDPLTHAVENAWRAGIVVVVSGGNGGTTRPSVDNPARDPYVVTVGADDIHATPASSLDDTVPTFSTRGSSSRRVDVVAPGQSIASLRDPGSYIDSEYPGAVVGSRYFKGSGTSQATAVVSGAAALLLQQRPQLSPDDVKRLLTTTAQPLPSADSAGRGAGLLNVAAAGLAPRPYAAQTAPRSSGLGTLEGARGTNHVGDNGVDLVGEQDIFGQRWVPAVWAPASSAGTAWIDGTWNSNDWTGGCWCGESWTTLTWSSRSWSSRSWSDIDWSSRSWSSRSWSSRSWSDGTWSSRSWSSRSWSGSTWSAAPGG
ncbi:MAG: serine protease AprX [Frankiaceae bacterium]|jgi:serine protease AprX|nr:serine protease AprX [Frankiaceae bacterium]